MKDTCPQNQSDFKLSNIVKTIVKTEKLSVDLREEIEDLHNTGMDYKTIS